MTKELKVGDEVICLPGFKTAGRGSSDFGGAGYEPLKRFIIRYFRENDEQEDGIAFPEDGHGVYKHALALYSDYDNPLYEIFN